MTRSSTPFRFKQFDVQHLRSTMKVGTDAVLLGAWTNVNGLKRILEIGAGCGVISLMLAQRTGDTTKIDALEPDAESCKEARLNVSQSPWPDKITVHETWMQEFVPNIHYDLIICNPPFFQSSLLPPDSRRAQARHTHTLTSTELLQFAHRWLSPIGRLAIILPTEEGEHAEQLANEYQLHTNRKLAFFSRAHKPQERWLLEFSKAPSTLTQEELVLYQDHQEWSKAYRQLMQEFYVVL